MASSNQSKAAGPPWWRLARQSRLGLGLVFAFLLPTLALSYLGIQSVQNEAVSRRQLLQDSHRSIRDIVGSAIDARIAKADRTLIVKLTAGQPDRETLLLRIQAAESRQPGLRPLLLLDQGGRILYPPRGRQLNSNEDRLSSGHWAALLSAGEADEFLNERPGNAAKLYARAVAEAGTATERMLALNAKARSELKAKQSQMALDTYKTLIAISPTSEPATLDVGQARVLLIAHLQIIACYQLMGNKADAARATVDLFRVLTGFRFIVEADQYLFYHRKLDEITNHQDFNDALSAELAELRKQERQQNAIAPMLDSLARLATKLIPAFLVQADAEQVARYFAIPESEFGVASLTLVLNHDQSPGSEDLVLVRRWRQADIAPMFEDVVLERGPWTDAAITLLDADNQVVTGSSVETRLDGFGQRALLANLPGWRVMSFPIGGSYEATAASDVRRYGLFLLLVLGTVIAGLALAARSITRELALSRLRNEFVSSVSHELRTPLAVIRMFAENLRKGWVSEEKKAEYYEVIGRESDRLTGLINNVLNLSRIESGSQQYQLVTTDLRELLLEILTRYQPHINAAEIELSHKLPNRPILIAADPEAIDQVLINLLSNAVKYIGNADRRVTVCLSTDADNARISVSDTGIGIATEQVAHIFEQYYRADAEQVRLVPGSGIGLTLVKHIIAAHGGEIHVQSLPLRGSTFTIVLPLIKAEVTS